MNYKYIVILNLLINYKKKKHQKNKQNTKKNKKKHFWGRLIWWWFDLMMVWLICVWISVFVFVCLFVCFILLQPVHRSFALLWLFTWPDSHLTWIHFSLCSLLTALPPHCAPSSLRSLLTASLLTALPPHCASSLLGSLLTALPLLCASSSLRLLENILRFAPHSFSNQAIALHRQLLLTAIAPHNTPSSWHYNCSSQQLLFTAISPHSNCS